MCTDFLCWKLVSIKIFQPPLIASNKAECIGLDQWNRFYDTGDLRRKSTGVHLQTDNDFGTNVSKKYLDRLEMSNTARQDSAK